MVHVVTIELQSVNVTCGVYELNIFCVKNCFKCSFLFCVYTLVRFLALSTLLSCDVVVFNVSYVFQLMVNRKYVTLGNWLRILFL
jgi:hypothetical protein